MKYAYYSGCSLHSTAKDYDMSTRAICKALGIELHDIPDWTCCGATSAHVTSEILSVTLPVKNLLTAREMGLDTAVCCAACYSRLKIANKIMSSRGGSLVGQVDKIVGRPYRGESKVRHLLEIVTDDYGLEALREKVSTRLDGLRVAAYYGCLLVRPPEVMSFDDPENPTRMEKLIAAVGAEAVDWPYRTECCGASLSLTRTDVVLKLCRDIYEMAISRGAECLMVACPLCHMNLDMRQAQINRQYKANLDLPVVYFTQLIGLGLGIDASELGLDKAMTNPERLLKAKALI